MQELYRNIRMQRERLGLSQDELAGLVGYTSRTSIAKIEAGKIDLPQSKVEAFAHALHMTPAALLGWGPAEDHLVSEAGRRLPILGEIAAVLIGDEATLKRIYYYPQQNRLMLNAENPAFAPLIYIGDELDQIKILGKAVAFQSPLY